MNYYNPYYFLPYQAAPATRSLLGGLFGGAGGIQWGTILNNIQRTLGIANQAIPIIRQTGPMLKNAKTMFRVMNEFKKVDTPTTPIVNTKVSTEATIENTPTISDSSGPTFFL